MSEANERSEVSPPQAGTVGSPLHDPACRRCPLWEGAKTVNIPGEGPLASEVMVVGIAPGRAEDGFRFGGDEDGWPHGTSFPQGRPFAGESGRLLRSVLLANGFAEYDDTFPELPKPLVRLTNAGARCRPPENRDPTADEMRACRTYLDSEIAAMPNLKYVVALGSIPMKVMGVTGSVTDLAGVPRKVTVPDEDDVCGIRDLVVIPVYHPAAVLRRQTYLSTWESHFHQIKNIVNPPKDSYAERIDAKILPDGLEGKDWRSL